MNSLSFGRKLPIFYSDEVIGFGLVLSSQHLSVVMSRCVGAEQAPILSVELGGAFIPDQIPRHGRINRLAQHEQTRLGQTASPGSPVDDPAARAARR
jgi:hypothetical protein